jgi:hypothetical protein
MITLTNATISTNTVTGGNGGNGVGGGKGGNGAAGQGGGLYAVGGTLDISGGALANNEARGGSGGDGGDDGSAGGGSGGNGAAGQGGGLYAVDGTLDISGTTVATNRATGGNGGQGGLVALSGGASGGAGGTGGASQGAGLYVGGGMVTLTNATISTNTVRGGNGGNGRRYGHRGNGGDGGADQGGAIYVSAGTFTVTSGTVAFNTAQASMGGAGSHSGDGQSGQGGGVRHAGGTLNALNTIVADNTAASDPDLYGSLSSSGYNLIGNSSGGSGYADTDLLDVDAKLGTLQDNGGPTKTMALLAGSPALNAGDPQLGVADQRGVLRGGGVNIGAYQASASAFVVTAPATVTAGMPFDVIVKAVDTFGQTAIGYRGTVHFASSDGQAVLPGDYPFTSADAGLHTFSSAVTLTTAGPQTVTATDTGTGSLTASVTVSVTPAAADHILLIGPTSASAGTPFDLVVTIQDAYGNTVTGYTGTVTFATDDADGTLPADYTFTAEDAGSHTFSGGMTLYADGSRITATDTADDTLTGSLVVTFG